MSRPSLRLAPDTPKQRHRVPTLGIVSSPSRTHGGGWFLPKTTVEPQQQGIQVCLVLLMVHTWTLGLRDDGYTARGTCKNLLKALLMCEEP